jgi:hypothetical protein
MPSEPREVNVESVWREQPREEGGMSLADIQARAKAHTERTRRQDILTWLVVAAVVISNVFDFALDTSTATRIGTGLLFLALVFVLLYYGRARGAVELPEELGLQGSIDFYRAQLVRQRNLVQRFWLWGALPFVPGIAVSMLGTSRQPLTGRGIALATVFLTLVALIAWMNAREAKKLQKEIDDL